MTATATQTAKTPANAKAQQPVDRNGRTLAQNLEANKAKAKAALTLMNREALPEAKDLAKASKPQAEQAKAKRPAKTNGTEAQEPNAEELTPAKVAAKKPMMRVLQVLYAAAGPLTRKQVAKRVSDMGVACYLGRISNETQTFGTLLQVKLISEKEMAMEEGASPDTVYKLTAAGKRAVEKATAAEEAKAQTASK